MMISRVWVCTSILLAAASAPQWSWAQNVPGNNGVVYGTFGQRTLGQSFTPAPSTFGGGIRTAPGGGFLYAGRANGSSAFAATPWRQINSGVTTYATGAAQSGGAATAATAVARPMAPAVAAPRTEAATAVPAAAQSYEESHSWQGGPAPAVDVPPLPINRSAVLSERMTTIARNKGILAGPGIDVYVLDHTARLEGRVLTLADRTLLANVLALEPQVLRVDNRLLATTPAAAVANQTTR